MKPLQTVDKWRFFPLVDVAYCPSGALVGSVTTQISTIHLTRQGSSSPFPLSPSPIEECVAGENQLSGWVIVNCSSVSLSFLFGLLYTVLNLTLHGFSQECVMQVDGVEEELPDELENACSDDSKMLKYTLSLTHTHTHTHTDLKCTVSSSASHFVL